MPRSTLLDQNNKCFIYFGDSHNQQGGMRGGRGGFRGRGHGGGGRGRGAGRGNGKKPVEKSAADLDKDLESYHADAMNTS